MNQREFTERYRASWDEFEALLDALGGGRKSTPPDPELLASFAHRYRRLSQQLSLARDRNYSPALVRKLNALVLDGHRQLYRARPVSPGRVLRFVAVDFPARVRADAALVWLATALLYLPALAMFVAAAVDIDLLYAFLDPEQARRFERMYDPTSEHFGRERASDSDFAMFGFYVRNNIGVGFQTFASGLLLGIGTVFYLVFNGLYLGAVAAHLYEVGFSATFSAFVVTHGAFELTAIALAGAAGLKLGGALIAPGRRSRAAALRHAARQAMVIVFGVVGLLVIAAFVEAFWSSSTVVPATVKYVVGGLCWVLVAAYFVFLGRGRESR